MATTIQIRKVRELEAQGCVVTSIRTIAVSGRRVFEMERDGIALTVNASGTVKF